MNDTTISPQPANVLPYSNVVGQAQLKLALELSYIDTRISGVLVSGERGSGKSTAVRAFARMVNGRLPVTLPINATEDRVVGGWDIGQLLSSVPQWKEGLIEAAHGEMLYVDEVNLLDDHIVNIILDVTASGLLTVERDSHTRTNKEVKFTLVGTMNPEEGMLRPQLLDRFGLMVDVRGLEKTDDREQVLKTVLSCANGASLKTAHSKDAATAKKLQRAREMVHKVDPDGIVKGCVDLASAFRSDGGRGEMSLALAACAFAARKGVDKATAEHLVAVAPLALQHRRKVEGQREWSRWAKEDDSKVREVLGLA